MSILSVRATARKEDAAIREQKCSVSFISTFADSDFFPVVGQNVCHFHLHSNHLLVQDRKLLPACQHIKLLVDNFFYNIISIP